MFAIILLISLLLGAFLFGMGVVVGLHWHVPCQTCAACHDA